MTPPLPAQLRERYRPTRVLGEGGFGVVLLAEDRELGRPVAIKLLRDSVMDAGIRKRFEREARLTGELAHPHVVVIYDFGVTDEGSAYIVYEYVEGEDLATRLERDGLLGPGPAAQLGRPLADALEQAHRSGIVHRDVKPQNVLLREGDHPLLCDFGIAGVSEGKAQLTALTEEGQILGTPGFMAPELLRGEAASPASDQFGLAATLLVAVTGQNPYRASTLEGFLEALKRPVPTGFPPQWKGRLPVLEPALTRAVAPDPAARFASMGAFREALSGASGEVPLSSTTVPTMSLAETTRKVFVGTPLRRAAFSLALVATAVLAFLYPSEAVVEIPPNPPPATEPSPALRREEARQRLERADAAIRARLPEPHQLYVDQGAFLRTHYQTLLEPALRAETEKLVGALRAWIPLALEASPPRPDGSSPLDHPPLGPLLEQSMTLLTNLVQALEALQEKAIETLPLNVSLRIQSATDQAVEEVRAMLARLLRDFPDYPGPRSRKLVEYHASWAYRLPGVDATFGARELETFLATREDPDLLARQVNALFQLVALKPPRRPPCQELGELAAPVTPRILPLLGSLAPDGACRNAGGFLNFRARLRKRCPDLNDVADEVVALEAATRLIARHCAESPVDRRAFMVRMLRDYRAAGPARSEAVRLALEELAEEIEAYVAAR